MRRFTLNIFLKKLELYFRSLRSGRANTVQGRTGLLVLFIFIYLFFLFLLLSFHYMYFFFILAIPHCKRALIAIQLLI